MVEVERKAYFAYHVTNIPSGSEEQFSVLRTNIADDETYDGRLVGLPVVSFSITHWNGGLPTISPYPRFKDSTQKEVCEGKWHKRVKLPISSFEGYKWWMMSNADTPSGQQPFLLTEGPFTDMLKLAVNKFTSVEPR